MRVALNLLGYTPGRGGVETYLVNLFRALQEVDTHNEYLVLCDPMAAAGFRSSLPNFKLQLHAIEKPSLNWFLRGLGRHLGGFDLLTRHLQGLPVDVMHHPLTTLNPQGLPYPAVLTFHDMQHEFFPMLFSTMELNRRHREYRASVEQAQAVIAISQHVKDSLVERYDASAEKIHVVHHGCSSRFERIGDPERLAVVVEKYSLQRPFMIFPAATWAHKNHLLLLNAVYIMVQQSRFDGELILTGVPMDFHGQVLSEILRLGLERQVRWLGYVPDEDLPCMYSLARLMVFPSLFEGFGLPVIEAMGCGCPVAVARATALPEIAGEAAFYFDPYSAEDIAATLLEVWGDEAQRNHMAISGLQRASDFSWYNAARKTIDIYQRVYKGK